MWSEGRESTWNGDYHTNINLQMNYWPCDAANLPETFSPLAGFVARLRRGGGRAAARYMYGVGEGGYNTWAGLGSGVERVRGGIVGAGAGGGAGVGAGRGLLGASTGAAVADSGDGGEAWVAHGFMDGYESTRLEATWTRAPPLTSRRANPLPPQVHNAYA